MAIIDIALPRSDAEYHADVNRLTLIILFSYRHFPAATIYYHRDAERATVAALEWWRRRAV